MNSKLVLVTGASRGIGLQIARNLAEQGYRLLVTANADASLQALREEDFVVNGLGEVHPLDLANRESIEKFAAGRVGALWGIVNNAGICKTLGIESDAEDSFDEVLGTNLVGPYLLTKKLLKHVSRPGRIVNISSQLGQEGRADYAAYCASKFGLIGITKCWAKELGSQGITVNAVCPGWVDTEMSRIDMERMAKAEGVETAQFYDGICAPLELKRFNSTAEVANLVSFLMSEQSSGITGRDWLMQTVWNQQ